MNKYLLCMLALGMSATANAGFFDFLSTSQQTTEEVEPSEGVKVCELVSGGKDHPVYVVKLNGETINVTDEACELRASFKNEVPFDKVKGEERSRILVYDQSTGRRMDFETARKLKLNPDNLELVMEREGTLVDISDPGSQAEGCVQTEPVCTAIERCGMLNQSTTVHCYTYVTCTGHPPMRVESENCISL